MRLTCQVGNIYAVGFRAQVRFDAASIWFAHIFFLTSELMWRYHVIVRPLLFAPFAPNQWIDIFFFHFHKKSIIYNGSPGIVLLSLFFCCWKSKQCDTSESVNTIANLLGWRFERAIFSAFELWMAAADSKFRHLNSTRQQGSWMGLKSEGAPSGVVQSTDSCMWLSVYPCCSVSKQSNANRIWFVTDVWPYVFS